MKQRLTKEQRKALRDKSTVAELSSVIVKAAKIDEKKAKELVQALMPEVARRPVWEILEQVFKEEGLDPPGLIIKKARNDLMHRGVLSGDIEESYDKYLELSHALSVLLLKLVGWDGEYLHGKNRWNIVRLSGMASNK